MSSQRSVFADEDVDMSESVSPSPAPSAAVDSSYLEPDYDIGEVRRALTKIKEQITQEAHATSKDDDDCTGIISSSYCTLLSTLLKVISNLVRRPVQPQHLNINLRNPAVLKKFGTYQGAIEILRFCGFEERKYVDETGVELHQLTLPIERVEAIRIRVDRATVIITTVRNEHMPQDTEKEEENTNMVNGDAIASSSVFLANKDDFDSPSAAASSSSSAAQLADEEMKPDLAPTYNIGDVRSALVQLLSEVSSCHPFVPPSSVAPPTPLDRAMHQITVREIYCQTLDTLCKITQNVLKEPVNPQHLRINLALPAVQKKFGQYAGAVQYLRFIGFREATPDEVDAGQTATPASPTNASVSQLLVLPGSTLDASVHSARTKINRALVIASKTRLDSLPTPDELERKSHGPISRDLRAFDLNRVLNTVNTNLGAADEVIDDSRPDMALVLAANVAERKKVHELARTDVIVMKSKIAELKEASRRRYGKTMIKITFSDKVHTQASGGMQQGSGRFGSSVGGGMSSSIRRGTGYVLGQPVATPLAQPTPTTPASATSIASPPSPAASSSSPTVAAAPAREVMVTAFFRPWETLDDLFHFLNTSVLSNVESYYLHLPPNNRFSFDRSDAHQSSKSGSLTDSMRSKTLASLGLVPAAAMYFHFTNTNDSHAPVRSVVDAIRPDILALQEGYDVAAIASMIPIADNKDELAALKARELAAERDRARQSGHANASASSSSSSGGGGVGVGDDDDDIESYMRRKKAAAAKAAATATRPPTQSNRTSNTTGAAQAKPTIPGSNS